MTWLWIYESSESRIDWDCSLSSSQLPMSLSPYLLLQEPSEEMKNMDSGVTEGSAKAQFYQLNDIG